MRVLVFSTKSFERPFFEAACQSSEHELVFVEATLTAQTAPLAIGYEAVCAYTNDTLDKAVLKQLAANGTGFIALRCAGFNQTDLMAAHELGLVVARVPAYSPESVAEHTLALMLTLNRKTHRAYARVREGNFSLEGLMGFTMYGKCAGVVGTGRIGTSLVQILIGLGCTVLAVDPYPSKFCKQLGARYVGMEELLEQSDIISLNCPLTPATHHLVDDNAISRMKKGVMLINTSRGGVVDTNALIRGLKLGHIGSVGLDVYEEEADLFYHDYSETVIQDDVFARLLTFPNVLITAHQGFLTREAITSIATTTMRNIDGFAAGDVPAENLVTTAMISGPT